MSNKFKNIVKNTVDEIGYYETKKLMGISFTKLAQLVNDRIPYSLAYEILIENIANKNLPTNYEEFKIYTSLDGVVYWETRIQTGRFLPDIIEHIDVVATPFWDGNKWTPVEFDWYELINKDTGKIIINFGSDGSYYRKIEDRTSFENLDDLFQWYKEFYLPTVYEMIMTDFLPNIQQVAEDELDEKFGPSGLKEQIRKILEEYLTETELTEKCWKGYTQKGMKTMFGKRYPNCVKKKKK